MAETLQSLSSEDFDRMMGSPDDTTERRNYIPFGLDAVIIAPGEAISDGLTCNPATGDGDGSEDEYPPFTDPNVAGTVLEDLA